MFFTGSSNTAVFDTPDILSCDEHRTIWISWLNGFIQVGRGREIGLDRIAYWQDPQPHSVHAISVSTGSHSEGFWTFTEYSGKKTRLLLLK